MKLLITGGHVTPALAVIDTLLKKHDVDIVFVGRKYINEYEKTETFEYQEVKKRDVPFIHLNTGRLTRVLSLNSIKRLFLVIKGFISAFSILRKEKPDVILSFGGYIALPIAFAGYCLHIPVYTHEQTISPGFANKVIGFFSKKVFVSFAENKNDFDPAKTIVTGNPVRESIFQTKSEPFKLPSGRPIVYVTGGSLGAHSINIHIEKILPQLLEKYTMIHQTGDVKEYGGHERIKKIKEALPESLQKYYFTQSNFYDDEIGFIYQKADLFVSRAGANTYFELLALHKPAILIPLPWSANGEQKRHAELFKEKGFGEVFYQDHPSEELRELIDMMIENKKKYEYNFSNLDSSSKDNAAEIIVSTVLNQKA